MIHKDFPLYVLSTTVLIGMWFLKLQRTVECGIAGIYLCPSDGLGRNVHGLYLIQINIISFFTFSRLFTLVFCLSEFLLV